MYNNISMCMLYYVCTHTHTPPQGFLFNKMKLVSLVLCPAFSDGTSK